MSDEQREHGQDEGPDASRTDQHPVPSYAGAPASEPEQQAQPAAAQPAAAQPAAAQPAPPPPPRSPYTGAPWPPYGAPGGQPTSQNPYFPPPRNGTAVLEKPGKPRGRTGIVVAALIAGLVGGGAAGAGTFALLDRQGSGAQLTQSAPVSGAAASTSGSIAAAAARAMPSTVDIQVNLAQGSGEGSGVILTADGDVLTNNHVVAGSTGAITVTLADGSEHAATVVGTSPSYDLAVIKIQGVSGLTPATLGKSATLQVGQQVVAIGSPQGLTGTVTNGIVSAFNRTVTVQSEQGGAPVVYNGMQTDAPINPGNSGGPLVNLDGQVVGINSAIATASSSQGQGGSIGLGFAIPIDQATRVAQEIMQSGSATKPVLGVTGSVQQQSTASGAQIGTVQAGSPAATAGLAAGDVVTKVGEAKVEDFADLIARIGSYAPGSQVALTVQSGSAPKTVQVTLGSQKDNAATTGTGGESQNPFGGGNGQSPFGGGSGSSPFGN